MTEQNTFRSVLRRLCRENKLAVFSAGVILLFVVLAILAPVITPYEFDEIVNAANRYFADKGNTRKKALDVSGSTMEDMLDFVKNGTPVIVWGTTNLVESKVTAEWEINGELIQWQGYEHCTVLMGYNGTKETVIVADPLRGIVEFDMVTFYQRYAEQHYNAVIISSK